MSNSFRAQIAVWYDSLAPKDAMMINPTFKAVSLGGTPDWDSLASDLATAVNGKFGGNNPYLRVRLYELPLQKPIIPVAEKVLNSAPGGSAVPRELALCLSYYSGTNTKRKRGRLYIPMPWLGYTNLGQRPTTSMMTDALGWKNVFTALGGVNVDWTVWSTKDNTDHPVTDCWVDNEWDIQRSRGLTGTTRSTATTTEGDIPNFVSIAPGGSGGHDFPQSADSA